MAKQSVVNAIKGKSKAMYKTGGVSPQTLRDIQKLYKTISIAPDDNALERKYFHGGYKGKACKTCFTKFSVNGTCNC